MLYCVFVTRNGYIQTNQYFVVHGDGGDIYTSPILGIYINIGMHLRCRLSSLGGSRIDSSPISATLPHHISAVSWYLDVDVFAQYM